MYGRFIISAFAACLLCTGIAAQEKIYFVDGFHGGVYGHYPINTYTEYMSGLLEKYPQWSMCLEIEPETWDTVKVKTPEAYWRFSTWTATDRVEFTNPAYAQPYMYNISGESIIRQLDYGMKKINGHFPDVEFSTYAVEEPCFTSALPQILRQFGFRYASLKCPNTCWGGYSAPYGGELVNWIGPDGTGILSSPRYECEALQDSSVWQTTAWGNRDDYIEACRKAGISNIVGMCYQDAGWTYGPWIGYGENVRNGSEYVTWKRYFEEKSSGKTDDDYIFSQEDVRPALMWGSQVLQTIARQVRHTENTVVQTEKAGVIAAIETGYRYDKSLIDEAWRTLMLAQHHDSWIVPYNRLNEKGTWADNIALWTESSDSICGNILEGVYASFSKTPGRRDRTFVRVFNTTGIARNEFVNIVLPDEYMECGAVTVTGPDRKQCISVLDRTDGVPLLTFKVSVPAFGFTTCSIDKVGSGKTVRIRSEVYEDGEVTVENSLYRMVFDASRGGVIKSLVVKDQDSREYIDSRSRAAFNELRGFFYDEGRFRSSVETPATVEVRDNGPVKTVTVHGEIASVPFVQTVILREGERKIDCRLKIMWDDNVHIGQYAQENGFASMRRACYDDRYKLSVLFPVALDRPQIYKDAPFDVCRSRLEDTFFETWDDIKHNVILHWVDLAETDGNSSLALLSDHTTSYSYGSGFPLGLTVQYSGGGLWGRDYRIEYPSEIHYSLVPHTGKWDSSGIHEESVKWNEPLLCSFSDGKKGSASLVDLSGTGYELSAAYMTDEGLVVRLFNASGKDTPVKIRFGFDAGSVVETDLRGNVTGTPSVVSRKGVTEMEVAMPRFGIRTYRIAF